MPRLLLLTGVILPMANYAFAQDSPDPTPMQCQLIRSAVAQYGFAAARQHALETYGKARQIGGMDHKAFVCRASTSGFVWTR